MATVQVAVQLSSETLLQAVEQLNNDELSQFLAQVMSLAEQRQLNVSHSAPQAISTQPVPVPESELMARATQTVPPEIYQRLQALVPKREQEALSEGEQEEFLELTRRVELLNVERMTALAQLAQRRDLSLTALMDSLGIKPIEYV